MLIYTKLVLVYHIKVEASAVKGIRSVRNKGVISLLRSTLYIRVRGPKEVLSPKSLEPDLKLEVRS